MHSAARTVLRLLSSKSNTCPLARALDTFTELRIVESRALSVASKARRRQYFHKVFAGACGTCQILFTLASRSAIQAQDGNSGCHWWTMSSGQMEADLCD